MVLSIQVGVLLSMLRRCTHRGNYAIYSLIDMDSQASCHLPHFTEDTATGDGDGDGGSGLTTVTSLLIIVMCGVVSLVF